MTTDAISHKKNVTNSVGKWKRNEVLSR